MPIKKENKHLYPKDWKQIRAKILERAGNCCGFCKVENHRLILRGKIKGIDCYQYGTGKFECRVYSATDGEYFGYRYLGDLDGETTALKVILTIAHLDHDPTNNDPGNLKALCQRCHNRYDRDHRNMTRKQNRLKGQIKLL